MSRTNRIVLAASLSLFPTALCAQTCLGGASFADRRAQIGADASVSSGARSSNGGVSIGSPSGLFASVGFGAAHDRDGDNAARLFAATAGIGVPRRTRPNTQICPFLSAVALSEKDFDVATAERRSSHAFGLGAGVGTILGFTPRWLEVVPFASAALVTQTTTIQNAPPLNTSAGTDRYYDVALGAGFVFAKVVGIRPTTTFSIADGRTTTSHGLHVSLGFGGVPRPRVQGPGSLATVWVSTRAGVYYCQGSKWYGATAYGAFMTEREALETGASPENGKRC